MISNESRFEEEVDNKIMHCPGWLVYRIRPSGHFKDCSRMGLTAAKASSSNKLPFKSKVISCGMPCLSLKLLVKASYPVLLVIFTNSKTEHDPQQCHHFTEEESRIKHWPDRVLPISLVDAQCAKYWVLRMCLHFVTDAVTSKSSPCLYIL